ncbi:MAG: hypothetical protein V3T72_19455 [Thermoanaerobaculia bacterium]
MRLVRARMYAATVGESTAESVRMHRDAARAMAGGNYPTVQVAKAHLSAAEVMIEDATAGGSASVRDVVGQLEAAKALLPGVAADPGVPSPLVTGLVHGILEAGRKLGTDRQQEAAPILETFATAREPQDALVPLLRAKFLVDYAWDARGHESYTETTSTRRGVFAERMAAAEKEAAKALALDPLSPSIAPLMLDVELGQGHGRARMESWFAYALAVDPGNIGPYLAKLHLPGAALVRLGGGDARVRAPEPGDPGLGAEEATHTGRCPLRAGVPAGRRCGRLFRRQRPGLRRRPPRLRALPRTLSRCGLRAQRLRAGALPMR